MNNQEWQSHRVMVFYGARDTRKGTKRPYETMTLGDIFEMEHQAQPKDRALAMLQSSYNAPDGRTHEVQQEHGQFVTLSLDIDKGNKSLKEVCAMVDAFTGDEVASFIYSTASATPELLKWRVIVPLEKPLAYGEWHAAVEMFFDFAAEQGIEVDRSLARANQPVYLPNVPPNKRGRDRKPLLAVRELTDGGRGFRLSDLPEPPVVAAVPTVAINPLSGALRAVASRDGPIRSFNDAHRIEDLLVRYGYAPGGGEDWRSPLQTSDSFATRVRIGEDGGQYWISLSESDASAGLGRESGTGARTGDAFDLFVYFEHNGDPAAALAEWRTADSVARLDVLRREQQRRENERIGEGAEPIPTAQIITLAEARERFVFLEDGSRVADRLRPHYDLTLADFRNAYSASKEMIPQVARQNADGSTTQRPPKAVPVVELWAASPQRLTVVGRTFKAGGAEFMKDPTGRDALNTWRPYDRSLVVSDPQAVGLFVEQVQYLFEDSTPRFLEWLAHIEQRPGVLPHTCWLHVATQFGLGRNWLGGLLARVWAGSVAANFDLSASLRSGFNDRLSRKVLAIVDEIDEGGGDTKWQHAETVKRMLTEETREINPKFGRKSVEYNACRMLLFSNHIHALPTVEGDRRVEVKILRAAPRDLLVYSKLYNALNDPRFAAAVAGYLGAYDLSGFNPGRRALMDESKAEFQEASLSTPALWLKLLRDHWPVDVIASGDLFRVLDGGGALSDFGGQTLNLTPAHRRAISEYGLRPWGGSVKVEGKATRAHVIRDHDRWLKAERHEIRSELTRWRPARADLRQELLELGADES
jgi:hypothetical protein